MSERFLQLSSRTLVLANANIDTDQIIPARFLTTTTREGLGAAAFYDWRYDEQGRRLADAPLNTIDPAEHRILVAGDNFGCGSSREHAPWALLDYGFKAVISTSIADIFSSNALNNSLLPIVVDGAAHARLCADPGGRVSIDVERCELVIGEGPPVSFTLEPFARRCLMEGVDTLGYLLERIPQIEAFESRAA